MAQVKLHTGPGVFAVLANVCRSPQEALKQFVENAADAIEQAKIEDGQIAIQLQYTDGLTATPLKQIAIQDNGVGMTPEKMRQVLNSIGDSDKINVALRGEQGIGLLAFALIAQELHLASGAEEGKPSSCLVLKRSWLKTGRAEVVERCQAHEHTHRGTVVYLEDILPEIASQLTKSRIKDYLGQQFASDLRANVYTMYISDDHDMEQIHSQRYRGVKVLSTNLPLGKGSNGFVELYVLPWEMSDANIGLYGRGGTRICLLTDLADFKMLPWTDQRLEGYIRCDKLKRTADKTAVVQDEVYTTFRAELHQLEPRIQKLILEVSTETLERRFNIIMSRAGRLIDKFLRYREKGLLEELPLLAASTAERGGQTAPGTGKHEEELKPIPSAGMKPEHPTFRAASRAPFIRLQSAPRDKSIYRSWYDPKQSVICINRDHAEFLLSQREDRRCLRYLFNIWAKESLLQEYGPQAEKVADEMVGVLAEAEPLLW
jgi:hypothetical protein